MVAVERRPWPPLGAIVLLGIGLALAPLLIGLPLMAVAVTELLAWAHGELPGTHRPHQSRAGAIAILLLAGAVVAGVVIGVATVDVLTAALGDDEPAYVALSVAAPIIAGFLFAPFALWPSMAFRGAGHGVTGAFWLAAHRGALRTALLGARLGAHGALPFALAILVGTLVDDDLIPLALFGGIGLTVLVAPATLRAVARAADQAIASAAEPARARPALSSLAALACIPLLFAIVVTALALLAPLPLREGTARAGAPSPVAIEGTDLTVTVDWRTLTIASARGPRTMRLHRYLITPHVRADRIAFRGEPAILLTLTSLYEPRALVMVIDEHGERLDDAPLDRIDAWIGAPALLLLALVCALGVLFALRFGGVQARLRALDVLAVEGGSGAAAPGELGVVKGLLRVSGDRVRVERERLLASGGAAIEADGGALRIALPETPVEIAALDREVARDAVPSGTPIAILLPRGGRLGGVGLRAASSALPAGAALIVGDPGRARIALTRGAFPLLVGTAVALGATSTLAALVIARGAL